MVAPTAGILRRPQASGFMGPMMILQLIEAVEPVVGPGAREILLKEAELFRLPQPQEPVREELVAGLHRTLRGLWPEHAADIFIRAGKGTAEFALQHRIPRRARSLLSSMPRTTGAWLLAKTTEYQSWAFAGSGRFQIESSTRFTLKDNPLLGGETSDGVACHFHAAMFERLFQCLIHPRLICQEVSCAAQGHSACAFEFPPLRPA